MPQLSLNKIPLTTSWQPYIVKGPGWLVVELTGTKGWSWSTDVGSGVFRSVGAFQREVVIQTTRALPPGITLIYFKGDEAGDIYEKLSY
jgi:hypothetical protein